MISLVRGGGRLPVMALALALGIWVFSGPSAMADGGPGLYPGFQGFGLGYHPGYGYGGDALGVGAFGGYPFYGGPGYPFAEPLLRRIGGIVPFPYYGGPGYPSPGNPNYFGGVGPLVADQPVITIGSDRNDPGDASSYGPFTGAIPYPDTFFAPFTATATAAAGGSSSGVSSSYPSTPATNTAPAAGFGQPSASIPPVTGGITNLPAQGRTLGIDEEPVIDASGVRGMKVSKVYSRERGGEGRSSCRRRDPLDQRLPHHPARQLGVDHRQCGARQRPHDERAHRKRRQRAYHHGPSPLIE